MTKKAAGLKQARRTGVLHLNGSPDQVYPLFTAQGELLWLPNWDPELIYPDQEETEEGTIFISSHAPDVKTYWLTISYDPETRRTIYSNVTPDIWIMRLDIACDPGPDGTTTASMIYTVTGLSKTGNQVVDRMFSEEAFQARTRQMEQWINHYLTHGEIAPAQGRNVHLRISDWLSGH